MKYRRAVLSLLVAVVTALVVWSAQTGGDAQGPPADPSAGISAPARTPGDSGLPRVAVADLPAQAQDTLWAIDAGGPFRHQQDGSAFGNFEGHLPSRPRGYYTEYTVETPGSPDRGARRIVAGQDGDFYYTGDHYSSFARIIR